MFRIGITTVVSSALFVLSAKAVADSTSTLYQHATVFTGSAEQPDATWFVVENGRVADVGSGAGLPGLVWAIARPDLSVTLIEPLLRRTVFLEETITKLGLDNVTVLRARAEDVHESYDVVTARAVAALDKLGRWCMPLVRTGGVLLALKGRTAEDEVKAATATLHRLGATTIVVATYGNGDIPTTVVEVSK